MNSVSNIPVYAVRPDENHIEVFCTRDEGYTGPPGARDSHIPANMP